MHFAGRRLALLLSVFLATSATAVRAQAPTVMIGELTAHPIQYGQMYFSLIEPGTPPLPDGSHGELWVFEGAAGDCVEIAMRSPVMDALLVLHYAAPTGDFIAVDDDSFGGTAALITRRLPESGPYYIIATSAGGAARAGEYWIRLRLVEQCPRLPGSRVDE